MPLINRYNLQHTRNCSLVDGSADGSGQSQQPQLEIRVPLHDIIYRFDSDPFLLSKDAFRTPQWRIVSWSHTRQSLEVEPAHQLYIRLWTNTNLGIPPLIYPFEVMLARTTSPAASPTHQTLTAGTHNQDSASKHHSYLMRLSVCASWRHRNMKFACTARPIQTGPSFKPSKYLGTK